MPDDRGRTIPLSLPRRWIGDMLHFARRVPTVASEKVLHIRPVVEARAANPSPPSWVSIFTKALAVTSLRVPELRQSFLPLPWPRLVESPFSVGTVVIHRQFQSEPATFLCPVMHPEQLSLRQVHDKIQALRTDPIAEHGALRRIVRYAKPPRFVRRLLWWLGLSWSGDLRARMFGTFAVNSVAKYKYAVTHIATPLTTLWYYGTVEPDGRVPMTVMWDHRVFDGDTLGRVYDVLEQVLNNDIAPEVRGD